MKTAFLIGRIIFGGFFLYSGINHFKQKDSMAQYAKSKNVPIPDVAVLASGTAIIIGGTSILLGIKPKLGTLAVAGFLAGVSPVMHNFWTQENPDQRMNEMIHFSKNMALLGASLALMGVAEPWDLSVPVAQPGKLEQVRRFAHRYVA